MSKISITLTIRDDNVTDLIYDLNTLLSKGETIEVIEMREVDDVRYELYEAA